MITVVFKLLLHFFQAGSFSKCGPWLIHLGIAVFLTAESPTSLPSLFQTLQVSQRDLLRITTLQFQSMVSCLCDFRACGEMTHYGGGTWSEMSHPHGQEANERKRRVSPTDPLQEHAPRE